jgi:hypothetical protein
MQTASASIILDPLTVAATATDINYATAAFTLAPLTSVESKITVVEKQSFALDMRDAMFNVVTANPYFAGYNFRKTKMHPVQASLIPFLGVYLAGEVMVPDGDANAGCIRFNHTTRIGFSVVLANNDQVALELGIDAAYQQLMVSLWTDLHLMNVLFNNNPEGVGIESITRASRRPVFGNAGLNNETPMAELEFEVSCFSRSEWYPNITDVLDEISVTTAYPPDGRDTTQIEQVNVVYDFSASFTRTARAPLRKPWLSARDQRRNRDG